MRPRSRRTPLQQHRPQRRGQEVRLEPQGTLHPGAESGGEPGQAEHLEGAEGQVAVALLDELEQAADLLEHQFLGLGQVLRQGEAAQEGQGSAVEAAEVAHGPRAHGQDDAVRPGLGQAVQALEQGPLERDRQGRHQGRALQRRQPFRQLGPGLGRQPEDVPAFGRAVRIQGRGGFQAAGRGLGGEHPLGHLPLLPQAQEGGILALDQEAGLGQHELHLGARRELPQRRDPGGPQGLVGAGFGQPPEQLAGFQVEPRPLVVDQEGDGGLAEQLGHGVRFSSG